MFDLSAQLILFGSDAMAAQMLYENLPVTVI